MPSIPELMAKIPQFTKRAELHDQISVKTLEIVNEINVKIDTIIIPKIEEIERKIDGVLNNQVNFLRKKGK